MTNITASLHLENTRGLWSAISAADLNNDGYEELLAGNWGENTKLHASAQYPLKLYVGDITGNGKTEQIMAIEKAGRYYPFLGKEELEGEMPGIIKKQFLSYGAMAGLTVDEIFGDRLKKMKMAEVQTLSSIMINNNKGQLTLTRLPSAVQWAPVFAFCIGDVNKDHVPDIITGGNFFGVAPYEGRYDAGGVNVLLNQGRQLSVLSPLRSGWQTDGEIRDIKQIMVRHEAVYLVARNNAPIVFVRLNDSHYLFNNH